MESIELYVKLGGEGRGGEGRGGEGRGGEGRGGEGRGGEGRATTQMQGHYSVHKPLMYTVMPSLSELVTTWETLEKSLSFDISQ